MKYEVLTKKSILTIQDEIAELTQEDQENALSELWNEQSKFLSNEHFAIHFLQDSRYISDKHIVTNNIEETIQYLAIKDGFDVVKFENGNMGIVAYYNGHENGLEFKAIDETTYYNISENETEFTLETI